MKQLIDRARAFNAIFPIGQETHVKFRFDNDGKPVIALYRPDGEFIVQVSLDPEEERKAFQWVIQFDR
jgi:hypothetical protein